MFTPRNLPQSLERAMPEFARWLRDEFINVERGTKEPISTFVLTPQYAAPKNPKAGTLAYADGTTWNPGSGEGIYRYTIAGAWAFVG